MQIRCPAMKIIIFDTETTGLPPRGVRTLTMSNAEAFPHIVQFSYIIYNTGTNQIEKIRDFIIKIPSELIISPQSTSKHGITREICDTKGVEIMPVLYEFEKDLSECNLAVGHNIIDFDMKMIYAECYRRVLSCKETEKMYWTFYKKISSNSKKFYCTMKKGKNICNIQATNMLGKEYIKYPRLEELYSKLFGYIPNNLHNSLNDCLVCFRCYYMIKYSKDICEISPAIRTMIQQLE